jgi:hypothetical protein
MTGDCLLWEGATVRGYGVHWDSQRNRCVRAHRTAYEAFYGPIPEGINVLHSCDNPACINPLHLRVGTQAQNMTDMYERGRGGRKRSKATECKYGHAYTEENTYLNNGSQVCRTCKRQRATARANEGRN